MLARMPHVRVDQQRTLPELGKHGRQIGRKPTAAIAALCAGDRQDPAACIVEPPQDDLTAQRAQRLNHITLRHVGRDDIIGDTALAATRQYRVIVLLCNGGFDVALSDALQLDRGFAESNPVGIGEALNFFHVLGIQASLLDEYGTDRAAAVGRSDLPFDGPLYDVIHVKLPTVRGARARSEEGVRHWHVRARYRFCRAAGHRADR